MDKAKFFQVVWKHVGQYAEKVANGIAGWDTAKGTANSAADSLSKESKMDNETKNAWAQAPTLRIQATLTSYPLTSC